MPTEANSIVIYTTPSGRNALQIRLENETLWLSQKQLTELFGKAKGTISGHIAHIFEDGELSPETTVRLFRTTAADGKQYEVTHYNIDKIVALNDKPLLKNAGSLIHADMLVQVIDMYDSFDQTREGRFGSANMAKGGDGQQLPAACTGESKLTRSTLPPLRQPQISA